MADDKNPNQQSGEQNDPNQKRNNPFSEQEKHGDEQPRRAPDAEQDDDQKKDPTIA
jgi:hypothetical protein